jgi:hypothetical protein
MIGEDLLWKRGMERRACDASREALEAFASFSMFDQGQD